jgi:hypothetical protein
MKLTDEERQAHSDMIIGCVEYGTEYYHTWILKLHTPKEVAARHKAWIYLYKKGMYATKIARLTGGFDRTSVQKVIAKHKSQAIA